MKYPKGWPSKDGRPAAVKDVEDYVAMVETHFAQETFATTPHFCHRCTSPLEFQPCPVCRAYQTEKVAKLRALLAAVVGAKKVA